jgi:biotin transport system substrate-specific component
VKTALLVLDRVSSGTRRAGLVVGYSILMGLLAHVSLPLPFTPVPVTGQTLGVLLAGILLGGPLAASAMLLYLAEGAMGLPVFSPAGPGGLVQLLGPTGGFLMSYPLAAFVVGCLVKRGRTVSAVLLGEATIFIFGAAWLGLLLRLPPAVTVLHAAVWPFLPGELLKATLAVLLARQKP